MVRYIKQFDPEETHRRIVMDIHESHCPGLLEFLSRLPFGYEGPGFRAIVYQWFLARQADGTLHDAFETVVGGPGGLSGTRAPKAKVQAAKRPSTKAAVSANRPKRAAQTAPAEAVRDLSPPVQMTSAQEVSPVFKTPVTFPAQINSEQPVHLTQQKQPQSATPAAVISVPALEVAAPENGEIDPEKITPIQFEALKNLDTMFN